jgi:hypothetical protein
LCGSTVAMGKHNGKARKSGMKVGASLMNGVRGVRHASTKLLLVLPPCIEQQRPSGNYVNSNRLANCRRAAPADGLAVTSRATAMDSNCHRVLHCRDGQ